MSCDTEAITARLANYHAHKDDPYAYYEGEIEAVRELRRCAPGDIAALLAEVSRLNAQIAPLQEFFWRCWDSARGISAELDGGDIQEWGEKAGLLTKVIANAPCGEGCVCADYVGDDFPTECYRPTVERSVSQENGT